MCGIGGVFCYCGQTQPDLTRLKKMGDIISYRGPDSAGEWLDSKVGLVFRRLAIIDLSNQAQQPMSNEDGTVQIVFNGEIYNYLDLRPELEKRGHIFQSRSDT
jgi:asparagine synthase (glutamine-hydrolysing)